MYFDYMTFLIIENGYDNILPNQFEKLKKIPDILAKNNYKQTKSLIVFVCLYGGIILILCLVYTFLIRLTNKSMTDGIEKVTKIRLEKIEEIMKRIKNFNSNLKKFKEKDIKSDDKKANLESDDENKKIEENKLIELNGERSKKKMDESSLINSNGFNTDFKKYVPLTLLNYSFIYPIIILLISIGCLIPIYLLTIEMIKNTNQLLLVENFIFGKLIITSTSTIEIKCFMSECNTTKILNYTNLVDMDMIQEVIKGVNIFPEVDNFYNYKFLLDSCAAAIKDTESEEYLNCINDSLIISSNNTDNLLKLIDDLIDSIKKEDEMNKDDRKNLFNTTYFRQIEYMFYNYIFNVGDLFAEIVIDDLNVYLSKGNLIVTLISVLVGVATCAYCLIFGIILIKRLVHHLSVSRCILKIIPTSVIISTQELDTWIENKY